MNTNKHEFKTVDEASCLVRLLCGVLLLLFTGCIESAEKDLWVPGELTFSVATPGGTIYIGDPYEVRFTAIYPTNGIVDFPKIGREKDIVVLNRSWSKEPFTNGYTKAVATYSITSFILGDHVICTDSVIYRHDGTTQTNPVSETVLSVVTSLEADAPSEIADIKPPHKLPGRIPPWIWMVLGTAAIAFLVGLISSKLWKNRATILPAAPPVPPHVIAFQALAVLKNKGLLEKNECNPFYTKLSFILRTYLEGRFDLNATDETTEEIVEEMSRSSELNGAQRNILQDFMRQADMVKFAKGLPDRTTMEAAFDTTKQFVEQTKLVGETVPNTGTS